MLRRQLTRTLTLVKGIHEWMGVETAQESMFVWNLKVPQVEANCCHPNDGSWEYFKRQGEAIQTIGKIWQTWLVLIVYLDVCFLVIFNLNCQPKHRNWKRCMMACLPRPWSDLSSARQSTQSRCLGLKVLSLRQRRREFEVAFCEPIRSASLETKKIDAYASFRSAEYKRKIASLSICKYVQYSHSTWEVFQDLLLLRTEPSKCHAVCCRMHWYLHVTWKGQKIVHFCLPLPASLQCLRDVTTCHNTRQLLTTQHGHFLSAKGTLWGRKPWLPTASPGANFQRRPKPHGERSSKADAQSSRTMRRPPQCYCVAS